VGREEKEGRIGLSPPQTIVRKNVMRRDGEDLNLQKKRGKKRPGSGSLHNADGGERTARHRSGGFDAYS